MSACVLTSSAWDLSASDSLAACPHGALRILVLLEMGVLRVDQLHEVQVERQDFAALTHRIHSTVTRWEPS